MEHERKPECQGMEEALNAYLDGETTGDEKGRIEAHFRTCAGCRQDLEDLRRTKEWVSGLEKLEVPRGVWPLIEAGIAAKKIAPLRRKSPGVAAAAAAAAFFFFTGVTLLGYLAPPQPPTPPANIYMAGHAYHVMRMPLSDQASWSYASEEAGFAFVNGGE